MITNLLAICQKVNIKLNLFEILIGFSIYTLLKFAIKQIVRTIRIDSIIDERLRERRARIARVAAEINYTGISTLSVLKSNDKPGIEDSNQEVNSSQTFNEISIRIEETSEIQTTNEIQPPKVDNSKDVNVYPAKDISNKDKERISDNLSNLKIPVESQNKKKTRAMSMEERWADFDKRRTTRNSA